MTNSKRVALHVVGLVQGVGFRWHSQKEAQRIGLTGFCRNLPDGSVQIEIQGNEEPINRFIGWVHHGVPRASVERVEQLPLELLATEDDFKILH